MLVTKISPAGYLRLKDALRDAELAGYGPDKVSAIAQMAVGLYPPAARELVVDYTLDGPVYPFMAWPEETESAAQSASGDAK